MEASDERSDCVLLKRQKTKYHTDIPNNLLAVKNLSKSFVDHILSEADSMKRLVQTKGGDERLKHRVLASIFYEPSTRTSCSFQAAMQRLGGTVVCVNDQQSSVQKGESIEDTVQTLSCYCDAIVIRHPMKGSADIAAKVASKPIINAGDGIGEHPTQALLDLYTIKSELGTVGLLDDSTPMTIAVIGDLKNGRTVHSLVRLLTMFGGVKLVYVSPATLAMPKEIEEELAAQGIEQSHSETLDEVISTVDVLYVTRIQKERFSSLDEYKAVCDSFCIDAALMAKAKEKMIVMHPLPRVNEIAVEVDLDPRAAYFRQMENGMYVRMALLDAIISNAGTV